MSENRGKQKGAVLKWTAPFVRVEFFVFIPAAPGILADCASLGGNAADERLNVGGQELIKLDFQNLHRVVKHREGGQHGVKHVAGVQARTQHLVKGDAHILRGMNIGFTDVVNDHRRTQQARAHLAVNVVQQGMAHALQSVWVAGDQLIGQLARDGHRLLGNQVAVFALAFELDDLV